MPFESRHVAPAAALRPLIAWYSGYRQTGEEPGVHRGLPSPYLTLIVTIDRPLIMLAHPDPAQTPGSYFCLAGGLHSAPALISHTGEQAGIQIALSPLGARSLLGLPAGELSQVDVDLADLIGADAIELQERVQSGQNLAERFSALDAILLRRMAGSAPPPAVVQAWHLLLSTGGSIGMAELAAETGWSNRHLVNRMRQETGLAPKEAARVIRFDLARRRLGLAPGSLADLAADCGYYDQSHLIRDFQQFAGCSPSRWLRDEFRNIQFEDGLPAED